MSPDEYVTDVLIPRQQAYLAEHPPVRPWMVPLLEWFIRDGDEAMLRTTDREGVGTGASGGDDPASTEATSRVNRSEDYPEAPAQAHTLATRPRRFRSAFALATERASLIMQRDALGRAMSDDPATARVGARLAAKNAARMDVELAKATDLDRRIRALDHRIAIAERRENEASE